MMQFKVLFQMETGRGEVGGDGGNEGGELVDMQNKRKLLFK